VLPEWADHEPNGPDLADWAQRVSAAGDVIVTVSRGRPSDKTASAIRDGGRSVVAITSSKAPRWVTGDPSPRFTGRGA